MADDAEASKQHGSTLFVSNLPFSATSVDLQTLFSDIGPVRSAFVVQDKETKISKGVGYVSFAIREDAQRVFDQQDLQLNGRKLRIQWPSQKNKDVEEVKPKKQPRVAQLETQGPSPAKAPVQHDGQAIRTIVISGLPTGVDSKVLWKKIRKEDGAEEIKYPVDGAPADIAHAVFTTPKQAFNASKHLHAHVFKGSLLSVTVKKRLDIVHTKKSGTPQRNSRLIVRNLPFSVTEDDLRATFLQYGPIYSVNIPQTAAAAGSGDDEAGPSSTTTRGKGFAFVWFVSKPDAEKAIAGANGKPMRLAEDSATIAAAGSTKKAVKRKGKENEARLIAVDWALSKNHWEAEKAKIEDAMEVDEEELASESEEESAVEGNADEGSASESEEGGLGVHDGKDSDEESDDDDAIDNDRSDDEEPKARPQLPDTDVGTTLFIRNVPYDATEDDIRTTFRAFGTLRYARITIDKETGRSRGTGFACFWNKEDADTVVEHSKLLREEIGDTTTATTRKNPFSMHSILTPDPSSSLARSLVLHGRTLDVTRAVTRDEAGKLKEQGERQREKADKRNLYLMREGVIFPNSPAAVTLVPAELEKRQASYNARRALLRSNPSLYVSKTRLSVRQLPPWASERVLKRLATHAARAFEFEVKAGSRQPLADDELHPPEDEEPAQVQVQVQEQDSEDKTQKKRWRPGERATVVSQAKIVRQADRLDPLTGKGRSRGYGFLQMTSHADALRVLRWANNNPAVETLMRSWFKKELEDTLSGKIKSAAVKEEEGAADTKETDKARKNRLKAKIEELTAKTETGAETKTKGSGLILEFSIENVQVVKKRREKQEAHGSTEQPQGKKRTFMDSVTRTDDSPRDKKRRKTDKDRKQVSSKSKSAAPAPQADPPVSEKQTTSSHSQRTTKNNLGGLIGRKRKERRERHG
ncbi:hypothetical protein BKA62DRAFT_268558 [Auriculariales sp. MPI-PUGE-AT-0066]|nr:hypothetical protein BKA62DRAFT_268558 [Auriculariales sp. MPI-PUGE-AT-0066]